MCDVLITKNSTFMNDAFVDVNLVSNEDLMDSNTGFLVSIKHQLIEEWNKLANNDETYCDRIIEINKSNTLTIF